MSDTEGTTVNAEGAGEVNVDATPSESTQGNEQAAPAGGDAAEKSGDSAGAPSETGEGIQTPGE